MSANPYLALGQLAGGTGLGIGAMVAGSKGKKSFDQWMQDIDNMPITPDEKELLRENVTAEFAQYAPEQLGQSAYANMVEDPEMRAAMVNSLKSLQQRAASGELDPAAKLALAQNQAMAGQQAKALRDAEAMQAQRRGVGGSGIDLANRALANQSAANNQYMEGMGIANMQDQAKLSALDRVSGLAGNIRSQDYGMAADKASAADRIAEFNANQSNAYRNALMGAQNQRAMSNADARRRARERGEDRRVAARRAEWELYGQAAGNLSGQAGSMTGMGGQTLAKA